MTTERIDYLYDSGVITSEEYNELMERPVVKESKGNSPASYMTLILALIGYTLMLTYTKNGHTSGFLSNGNQRLLAGIIFSILAICAFFVSKKWRVAENYKDNYAQIGLGVVISILMIVIPVLLFSIT